AAERRARTDAGAGPLPRRRPGEGVKETSRRQEGGVIRSARLSERRLSYIRIAEEARSPATVSKIVAGPTKLFGAPELFHPCFTNFGGAPPRPRDLAHQLFQE